jgi:hypothetical protein
VCVRKREGGREWPENKCCMCVCVVFERECMDVCVCVCVREGERERERENGLTAYSAPQVSGRTFISTG